VSQRPVVGCLFEIVETLVLTLVIFLVIQNFVAQPYQVKQQSMQQTLEPNQYVLVDKLTPRFDDYKRGDIVVFDPPATWAGDGTPFIKRIVGVGDDDIEIRDDGFVYVNGVKLDEPYLYQVDGDPQRTEPAPDQNHWRVPKGDVFVMGDHRSNSADSRVFGSIPRTSIIGRAWLRYWPFDAFGVLPTPKYPELQPAAP
jgi:signal peptidase I